MCVLFKCELFFVKFYFCGKFLEYVNFYLYLGVEIDNRFRWKENINYIYNIVNNVKFS